MANIKLSAIVTEIRGSIGGTTFQKSTSGTTARNKTTGVNTRTHLQSESRSLLFQVQQNWRALPNDKKNEWNLFVTYAKQTQKNNTNLPITGQQHYIKTNVLLMKLGYEGIVAPQFTAYGLLQQNIEIDTDGSQVIGLYDFLINTSFASSLIYLSMPVHSSLRNPGNRMRLMVPNQIFGDEVDLTTSYAKHFGLIPPNNTYLFLKWSFIDRRNGLIGAYQQQLYYTS